MNTKLTILTLLTALSGTAQEFTTSFEEFADLQRPSFVAARSFQSGAAITPGLDTGDPGTRIPAFSGRNLLAGVSEIFISSPDGGLISEFSLKFFVHNGWPLIYYEIADTRGRLEDAGEWQTFSRQFEAPVSEFRIFAFAAEGERVYPNFAVDDLRLVTIPEPSSISLVLIGFGLLWLNRTKENRELAAQNRND